MSSSCWVPAPPPAKRMHLARNDQTIAGLDGADCSVDLLRMGNHVTGLACYTDNELAVDSALPVDFLYGNSSGGNGSSAFDHLVAPVPAWLLSAVVDNGVSDKGSGSNGSTRTQGSSASVTLGAMPGTSATFDVRAVHQRQQLGGCPWQQHGWSCAPDGASPLGSLLVGDASIDLGLDFLLRGDAAPGGLGWQAGIDAASSYLAELGPFNINTTSLSCLSGHELEESSDSLVMDEFLSMVGAG